jgi:hypothetical protein
MTTGTYHESMVEKIEILIDDFAKMSYETASIKQLQNDLAQALAKYRGDLSWVK